jgi:hypothetical protein
LRERPLDGLVDLVLRLPLELLESGLGKTGLRMEVSRKAEDRVACTPLVELGEWR